MKPLLLLDVDGVLNPFDGRKRLDHEVWAANLPTPNKER